MPLLKKNQMKCDLIEINLFYLENLSVEDRLSCLQLVSKSTNSSLVADAYNAYNLIHFLNMKFKSTMSY